MIAYLQGKLAYKCPTYILVDVQGVGYMVHISMHTYGQIGPEENIKILTFFRPTEDAHLLYGFMTEDERKLFTHLISVSGIGLNTARLMLSSMQPAEIEAAIVNEDVATIQRIKGIGIKTAQRTIIELKDKLRKERIENPAQTSINTSPLYNNSRSEALQALAALGFAKAAAESTIANIIKNNAETLTVEQLIKLALKQM